MAENKLELLIPYCHCKTGSTNSAEFPRPFAGAIGESSIITEPSSRIRVARQ